MGASNEIAHIRLAKQLMSLMAPIQYNPLFEQRDATGQLQRPPHRSARRSSTGPTPTSSSSRATRPTRRRRTPWRTAGTSSSPSPTGARTRRTTRSKSCTWCAASPTTSGRRSSTPIRPTRRSAQMTVWGQGAVNVNTANPLTLYALVCSGAPTAELCTDPTQMQMFVMGVTMAQGITMGAPLFGTPGDFIQMMKGQGQLGPLLTTHGHEAGEVPVGERLREEHLDREQGLLDLRGRRRQGIQARDARPHPHRGRLPLRAVARQPRRARRRPRAAPTAAPAAGGGAGGRVRAPTRSPPRFQPSVGGQVLYFNIE